MAKMILEYAGAKVSIDGSDALIERERAAFYDFIRSLPSVPSDERIQTKGQKSKSKRKAIPSWAELKQAANEGRLSNLVKSGDRLPLTLKNGERIDLDVGRDETGRTYFIFHYPMKYAQSMNFEQTNKGGWRDCEMRRYANEDVYKLLPDKVKEVIVPTRITQVIGEERIETKDNLFCLSMTQVFGKDERWSKKEPEDTRIDIFWNSRARIKTQPTEGQTCAFAWWLRSTGGNIDFYYVNDFGLKNDCSARSYCGVILSFCIEDDESMS